MKCKFSMGFVFLAIAFVYSSDLYAMSSAVSFAEALASGSIDAYLNYYYKPQIKELDLTKREIGSANLENAFTQLKKFIEDKGVKRLVLDYTGLTHIPFELFGLGIINKTLGYISVRGNEFSREALDDFNTRAQGAGQPAQGAVMSALLYLCKQIPFTKQNALIIDVTYEDDPVEVEKSSSFSVLFKNFPISTVLMGLGILVALAVPQIAGPLVDAYPAVCHTGALVAIVKACNGTIPL